MTDNERRWFRVIFLVFPSCPHSHYAPFFALFKIGLDTDKKILKKNRTGYLIG